MTPPVVKVSDPPAGLVELKVTDSRGTRIGFFQVAAADLDDELIDAIVNWQARHAHQGSALSIMPAASPFAG